ncbi:helix-turn-helix domain-containing protein [Mycobacteroides sp. LB1]|uniref:helix-turn-helix domain-containing protein n=1 Tax=Mycobacteroides sp. LB1 TaxID=2750814 RepID=UPI001C5F0CBD
MKIRGAQRTEERAALKAAREGGTRIRAAAVADGYSYGYVHDALIETGTQLRGRGGPNKPNQVPFPPETTDRRRGSRAVSDQ